MFEKPTKRGPGRPPKVQPASEAEPVLEEKVQKPKAYVYRSNWDFGLGLKPITTKGVPDGAGGFSHMVSVPAVRVAFINSMCVLDETMAKRLGYPLETLVEWMEMQPGFNCRFFRAEETSPEELAKLKMLGVESKTTVVHGARATKN